jgi:hypothetical protein
MECVQKSVTILIYPHIGYSVFLCTPGCNALVYDGAHNSPSDNKLSIPCTCSTLKNCLHPVSICALLDPLSLSDRPGVCIPATIGLKQKPIIRANQQFQTSSLVVITGSQGLPKFHYTAFSDINLVYMTIIRVAEYIPAIAGNYNGLDLFVPKNSGRIERFDVW